MKKWNKATTAALLTAFVMTGALPAHAEEPAKTVTVEKTETKTDSPKDVQPIEKPAVPSDMIQEEQAIAKVREMFGGLADLKQVDAHYTDREDHFVKGPAWSLNFSEINRSDPKAYEEARKKGPIRSIDVWIDAKTGELLRFQDQNPAWLGKGMPEKDQAIQSADAFMKKHMTSEQIAKLSKGYAFGGSSGGGYTDEDGKSYTWMSSDVEYCELVNGIPFQSNVVRVGVDQYGHVVKYEKQFRFDSSKLPKPEGIVSKAVATIELAKRMNMDLHYQSRTMKLNKDGDFEYKDNPVLVYQPNGHAQIDAFTGKLNDMGFQGVEQEHTKHKVTGEGKVLTAKTKEEAAKLASDLLGVDMSNLIFEEPHKSPFRKTDEETVVHYSWHENYEKRPQDVQNWQPLNVIVGVDTKTGQVLQLNRSGGYGEKPTFTVEEGKKKALDILKQYVPQGEQELMLTFSYDATKRMTTPSWYKPNNGGNHPLMNTEARYTYYFAPTYQGLPIADLNYSAELNAENGKLISLMLPKQQDVKLPDSKGAVNPEVVEATFLQNHPLTLHYQWGEYFDQQAPQGQLVYDIDWRSFRSSYIDALTGHEVSER